MSNTDLHTSPIRRLPDSLRRRLMDDRTVFDVHCHLFTNEYIPDNYFHIRLPWLFKETVWRKLIRFLQGRRTDDQGWTQRASEFMDVAGQPTMLDVARGLLAQSNDHTVFCPLMMDMTQAYGPNRARDVFRQMDEMAEVTKAFPGRFMPFVAIDPRNPDVLDVFRRAFAGRDFFLGVKIYPLLGYLPSHPILMEIFEVCEALGIPVATHCGGYATRAPADRLDLPHRRYDVDGIPVDEVKTVVFGSETEKGRFLTDPMLWKPVLERFPSLKLNLAHFGGDVAWKDFMRNEPDTPVHRIVQLMDEYDGVYSDVSFLFHLAARKPLDFSKTPEFSAALERLMQDKQRVRERVLFGSDYYMMLLQGDLPVLKNHFLLRTDDDAVHRMTRDNPMRYLGLDSFRMEPD